MADFSGVAPQANRLVSLGKEGEVCIVYLDTPGPDHDESIIYSPDCIEIYLARVAASLGISVESALTDLRTGKTLEVSLR